MTTVYVREHGAVIRKSGEVLRVTSGNTDLLRIPLADLTQLVLMGNVQLTTPAAILLLRMEVDVVFMSYYGKFYGRLNPNQSKYAELRHQQLRLCDDSARSLALSRRIVAGKVANQRVVLLRRADGIPQMTNTVDGMLQMGKRGDSAADLDQLRGFEGKAAAYYFQALRLLLDPAWGFEARKYYPLPDPINALLSLAYSLLRKDVEANLQIVGLDSYLGFFHTLGYDRPALALDLMEDSVPPSRMGSCSTLYAAARSPWMTLSRPTILIYPCVCRVKQRIHCSPPTNSVLRKRSKRRMAVAKRHTAA
ncbi:MAG: CRISPR-associated endonuclease Cas1 [Chloroflexi bacterium]|nr:CRISPR-associated endonuclease Cas1 [Chloroflexota bacterium]